MIVIISSVFQCIQSFLDALIMTAFSDLHCCVEEENYNADGVDWHDHLKFPNHHISNNLFIDHQQG